MKTPEQIKHAIELTEQAVKEAKERLHDVQVWIDAANVMEEKKLFEAQVLEKFDLRQRIYGLEKQIDAYNYTLGKDRD